MRNVAKKYKIMKDNEGTMFEIRLLDTVRKVAILKQISDLDDKNEVHGTFALMVGGKLTKYMAFLDAKTQFDCHQQRKVA